MQMRDFSSKDGNAPPVTPCRKVKKRLSIGNYVGKSDRKQTFGNAASCFQTALPYLACITFKSPRVRIPLFTIHFASLPNQALLTPPFPAALPFSTLSPITSSFTPHVPAPPPPFPNAFPSLLVTHSRLLLHTPACLTRSEPPRSCHTSLHSPFPLTST